MVEEMKNWYEEEDKTVCQYVNMNRNIKKTRITYKKKATDVLIFLQLAGFNDIVMLCCSDVSLGLLNTKCDNSKKDKWRCLYHK